MGSPLAHTTGDQPCSLAKKGKGGENSRAQKERRKGGNLFFFFFFLVSSSSCISYSLGPLPRPSVLICRQRKRKRRGAMRQGRKGGGVLIPEDQGKRRNKGNKRRRCFMLSLLSHPNHCYYSTMYSILPKQPESNPSGLSRPCLLLSFLPSRRFPLFFGKDISRARDGRGKRGICEGVVPVIRPLVFLFLFLTVLLCRRVESSHDRPTDRPIAAVFS